MSGVFSAVSECFRAAEACPAAQPEGALPHYERALALVREAGDAGLLRHVALTLAEVYLRAGQPAQALAPGEEAARLARDVGDRADEAAALAVVGAAFANLGHESRGIDYLDRALLLAEATGARERQAHILQSLAGADHARALEHNLRALQLVCAAGDRAGEERIQAQRAQLYLGRQQPEQGIACLQRAAVAAQAGGNWAGSLLHLREIGDRCFALGDLRSAVLAYEDALSAARQIGDRAAEGGLLGQLGLCHDAQGDGQRAGACFQQAATIAQLLVDYPSEARWAGNLGNTFHRLRQYPQAIGCYGRTLDIARYLGDPVSDSHRAGKPRQQLAGQSGTGRARRHAARRSRRWRWGEGKSREVVSRES
ncbi:MAG: tetratricopeptide repeat protein [Chloroflexia bacterium]